MSRFDCPHCNSPLKCIPLSRNKPRGSWERREMRNVGVAGPSGDFDEYERSQPIGRMSMEHNVKVPLVFAVITAILLAVGSWYVVYYNGWPLWIPLAVFFGTMIVSWFVATDFAKRLLFISERVIGRDIDSDGHIGRPHRIKVEVKEETAGGRRWRFLDLDDVDPETLQEWAKAVAIEGQTLTVPRWTGAGQPFTQTTYSVMCSQLEARGFVINYGGSKGRALTAAGRAILKELAR